MNFDHYQELAFFTASYRRRDLLEVCLAAVAIKCRTSEKDLPEIEITLNGMSPIGPST